MDGTGAHDTAYMQAAEILPEAHFRAAMRLNGSASAGAEEFRLRVGQPVTVVVGEKELEMDGATVTEDDLRTLLERASRSSAHTVLDQVCAGFLTIRGGHRIGLCGTAVMQDGKICGLDRLSSAAVRIARPVEVLGGQAVAGIAEGGTLHSTLILAPPGAGKTTLLRETVRRLSDGIGAVPRRVGLADERGEVAAVWDGRPQLDVGRHTDVMSGCPKAEGIAVLLRGMRPEVLAVDEITASADLNAIVWAAGCGVMLLATAHGGCVEDLGRRPLYRRLLELGVFQQALLLENRDGARVLRRERLL